MRKKIIAWFCIFIFAAVWIPPFEISAALRQLTLEEAQIMGVENSYGVKDVVVGRIQKQIELQQAKEGIRDIRKKESTIRYSLLTTIEWPEKHGLPKEIDLVTKIPQIETDIANLDEQEKYERLKARYDAEAAFIDVIAAQEQQNHYETLLEENKELLEKVRVQYQTGIGDQEDVSYMENEVESAEKQLRTAISNLASKKENLGSLIGVDVNKGYSFDLTFPTLSLKRSDLPYIIEYSLKNDYELFKTTQARKLAEVKVDELNHIYENRFGKYVQDVESYLKTTSDIDYEVFIRKYNHTLDAIAAPWQGYYKINLLFFTLKIPKEWFQGEYDGLRYFEDEKYALFVSLVERDRTRRKEEQTKKELKDKLNQAFSTLKQMEIGYEEVEKNYNRMQKEYEEILKENKIGLASFQDVDAKKKNQLSQEDTLFEMKADYAKTIASFNLSSSGFIDQFVGADGFDFASYNGGDSFRIDETEGSGSGEIQPKWYVKQTITDYKFTFGLSIPETYGITHYELFTNDNQQIGKKTEISKNIVHLPITYGDSTRLYVKLYQQNEVKYIAEFDGAQYGGTLNLQSAQAAPKGIKGVGIWKLKISSLKGEFSINLSDLSGFQYELIYNDQWVIGKKTPIDKSIVHLASTFSDFNKLKVRVYNDQDVVIAELELKQQGDQEGILILNE